ncbi:hypothetical protein niasHT_005838 [Heterodera trifolii]|uniref:G-protein coupled receptors family 1 profile domain-containing protein n=1 Tax=Heterodera trifolii TaxID=157864 RepID=A0ABD2MG64_9BILA
MNSSEEAQVINESELYLRFKDARPCWPFIGLSLPFGILATVGIVMNTLHIYVTIKTKSLHGTSFILLALVSAFESVHLSGQYLFPFVALTGQNFIGFTLAAKICAPSFFALQCIGLLMLSTGIDRLISIRDGTEFRFPTSDFRFPTFLGSEFRFPISEKILDVGIPTSDFRNF